MKKCIQFDEGIMAMGIGMKADAIKRIAVTLMFVFSQISWAAPSDSPSDATATPTSSKSKKHTRRVASQKNQSKATYKPRFNLENQKFSSLILSSEEMSHLTDAEKTEYFINMIALSQVIEGAQMDIMDYEGNSQEFASAIVEEPSDIELSSDSLNSAARFLFYSLTFPANANPALLGSAWSWVSPFVVDGVAFVAGSVAGKAAINGLKSAGKWVVGKAAEKSKYVKNYVERRANAAGERVKEAAKSIETASAATIKKDALRLSEDAVKLNHSVLKEAQGALEKASKDKTIPKKELDELIAKRETALENVRHANNIFLQKRLDDKDAENQLKKLTKESGVLKFVKDNFAGFAVGSLAMEGVNTKWNESVGGNVTPSRKLKEQAALDNLPPPGPVAPLAAPKQGETVPMAAPKAADAAAGAPSASSSASTAESPDSGGVPSPQEIEKLAARSIAGLAGSPTAAQLSQIPGASKESEPAAKDVPAKDVKLDTSTAEGDKAKKSCIFGGHPSVWKLFKSGIFCTRPAESRSESCSGESQFLCNSYGIKITSDEKALEKELCLENKNPLETLTVRCSEKLMEILKHKKAQVDANKNQEFLNHLAEALKRIEDSNGMKNDEGKTMSIAEYCSGSGGSFQKPECGAIKDIIAFLKSTKTNDIIASRPVAASEKPANAPTGSSSVPEKAPPKATN